MAFERLQHLGKDKFARICNELARGTPALTLARRIQREWGDVRHVAELTLTKQLLRLRTAITTAAFGGELAQVARHSASVKIKRFHGSSLECLDELETLAAIQRVRVLTLYERERASGQRVVGLNKIVNDYRQLLLDLQKIRFDLGLDEYKRGFPPATASATSATACDRAATDQQVLDACAVLDEVLAERRTRG